MASESDQTAVAPPGRWHPARLRAAFAGRHPPGLATIFLTEMWERFSYYGMRALLVLYLVNALDLAREDALQIYATYTALVYLTPVLGGYLADRWLGTRRAVAIGAIVMAMGHFAMAFPALLHLALGLLIAGNGFFKPNMTTLVGALYRDGDPRRDSGFTIYYMGINLGAFLAPLVAGTLGEKLGWHYGFAAAGIGMVAGLLIFLKGQRHFGAAGLPPGRDPLRGLGAGDWWVIGVSSAATLALVAVLVAALPLLAPAWNGLGPLLQAGIAALIIGLYALAARLWRRWRRSTPPRRLDRIERERVAAIAVMGVFVVFFWMGFEQAGGTMNLFADKRTDRVILGWEMPATYFQAVNPLLILMLAPLFSLLWGRLDRSPYGLSAPAKQGLGMVVLGLGFLVLAIADQHAQAVGRVSPLWLLAVYLLHTTGELLLSPIGLSMVTKLAPARLVSLLMGLWFTAIALANYLAGTLEEALAGSGIPLYWFLVGSSTGAGLLLIALSPLLHRLMHGVR